MPNAPVIYTLIHALLSGDYDRGSFFLRRIVHTNATTGNERRLTVPCYCPMGVLCDLHAQMTGEGSWTDNPYSAYKTGVCLSNANPPIEVTTWAGISVDQVVELQTFNDHGASFEMTARKIAQDLLGLPRNLTAQELLHLAERNKIPND